MSSVRLTFLYPHFFRAARLAESATQPAKTPYRRRPRPCNLQSRSFTASTRVRQAAFERHGTAVEPLPVVSEAAKAPPQLDKNSSSRSSDLSSKPKQSKRGAADKKDEDVARSNTAKEDVSDAKAIPSNLPNQERLSEKIPASGPMEAVLQTTAPPPNVSQHTHIQKPTYVHHFDSYTLVKQLEAGGFTQAQAITVMKGIRSILAQNLDVAQEGLVWKSDVDNETYLFRAACSELNSEVTNNRGVADDQIRQQRTQLQHEFDILNQRMTQDIMTLKDNVKGMFNDRRMHVREEQRNRESAIQQVNLKISATLNSDSKSDIEGLRWVLMTRAVWGILIMAVVTLSIIPYVTYVSHARETEAKEKAHEAEELKKADGREDRASPVDAAEILAAN
ncbi:hypothetical protein GGS21DRAFT_465196 [Xylaria nigripes]|nr:hypothetical protein GGS21DRAFT_465196 [Xylaria nigripes]